MPELPAYALGSNRSLTQRSKSAQYTALWTYFNGQGLGLTARFPLVLRGAFSDYAQSKERGDPEDELNNIISQYLMRCVFILIKHIGCVIGNQKGVLWSAKKRCEWEQWSGGLLSPSLDWDT
jgi:hypothetical protein